MLRRGFTTFFALCVLIAAVPARTALAPVASAAELPSLISNIYLHVPRGVPADEPVQVLIALHGMGGLGDDFAAALVAQADQNGWLLVAPTIQYGDWTDPGQIANEEPRLIVWLRDYIDQLSLTTGLKVKPRVLLLGHSRGAQLAHRLALFEPEKVLAVAALSAGTYTLPIEHSPSGGTVTFPYGVGDLKAVAGHAFEATQVVEDTTFWIGVGSDDNNPADLPRAWDPFLGTTRVARAAAFQDALRVLGARSALVTFRGQRHALTQPMADSACSFLRAVDLAQDSSTLASHQGASRAHF